MEAQCQAKMRRRKGGADTPTPHPPPHPHHPHTDIHTRPHHDGRRQNGAQLAPDAVSEETNDQLAKDDAADLGVSGEIGAWAGSEWQCSTVHIGIQLSFPDNCSVNAHVRVSETL